MTITHGYTDLVSLKHPNRLNIQTSDSVSDDMLEAIIESVSRRIDDECGRRFYSDSGTNVRYYTAVDSEHLFIDDMASLTSDSDITIQIDTNGDGTYDNTFTATDYALEPYNAELDGVPYQKITRTTTGQYLFPKKVIKGVKVTAKWGWASVPKPIQQACLLQSERIFMRAQTPIGSTSMTMLGKQYLNIPSLDPDVDIMISRYKKIRFG